MINLCYSFIIFLKTTSTVWSSYFQAQLLMHVVGQTFMTGSMAILQLLKVPQIKLIKTHTKAQKSQ